MRNRAADATAGRRHRALGLRAENLFDAEVQSGISEAGLVDRGTPRTLWAGLRFELD
jgi:hypothetical protein